MSIIAIPEILEQKLTHKGAEALVILFNSFEERAKKDILNASEDKFSKSLTDAISGLKTEFKENIANIRVEIAQSESRLEGKIANVKIDIIKWVVGIAFAQTAIILAVLSFVMNTAK